MKVGLSVVVPAFNCQDTIEDCLASVRRSSYQDYELIVADDGSRDRTGAIAKQYADKVIPLVHRGRTSARANGLRVADGAFWVNIDSDVLIQTNTLAKIVEFFQAHPEIDALTGCLSKDTPATNFFSQYKNLYMHYMFSKLPERVTFLYGSIYAVRAKRYDLCQARDETDPGVKIADDTALGQGLAAAGKPIAFLKDLQVTHLKQFTWVSFFRNDFQIPFDWAKIFLHHQGWRQLGKNGTGFCHSPKEQLLSVVLAPLVFMLFILTALGYALFVVTLSGVFLWLLLNSRFLAFLSREKGLGFGLPAAAVTFMDHIVMAAGIACGAIAVRVGPQSKKEKAA